MLYALGIAIQSGNQRSLGVLILYHKKMECQAVYAMECLTIRSENASIFEPLVVKGLLKWISANRIG